MTANRRTLAVILLCIAAALLLYLVRAQAALLIRLVLSGAVIAYLFFPICQWLSRKFHFPRTWSIAGAFLSAAALIALICVLFLPPLLDQMRDLIGMMPTLAQNIRLQIQQVNARLSEKGFGQISLPEINWDGVLSSLSPLLGGTASFAGSVISRISEGIVSLMLGYYFLRDRERLLLHLELMVPSAFRRTALKMAAAVHQQIGAFLRGQLLISLIVSALSAAALGLVGVKSFLALGLIVGIFNMIPYFGPILGAVPAVLTALSQGFSTALLSALALLTVQQIDSFFISPRVMGSLTGLHPGTVLLSITVGSSFAGIGGMLLAIPFLLTVRAVSRVWLTRNAVI